MFHSEYPIGLRRRLDYGDYVRNRAFPQLQRDASFIIQGIQIRVPSNRTQQSPLLHFCHTGLSLQTLQRNSTVYTKEYVDCSICYDNEDKIIRKLSCGHEFHLNCIDKWLAKRKNCPYCRKVFW
jgi:hypothetical protein